jgi:putative transposase
VTSDGEFVDNPKFYRTSEKKLKRLQRKPSKCKKGSKNREKARIRYAKAAKKVADKRNYFLHSVANKLINENQVISFETLNVSGMMKNHKLAKSIQDAAWARLIQIVSYKAEWYGREVNKIGRFVPSSKTCSACGEVNNELTLKDRIFKCQKCGHKEDRDLNASKNIKNFSRDELTRINASGETVSRHLLKEEGTLVP